MIKQAIKWNISWLLRIPAGKMGKPAGSLQAQPRIWTRDGTGRGLDSRLPDYKYGAVTARSRYLLYILKYFLMLKLCNTKNICKTQQFVGMKKKN